MYTEKDKQDIASEFLDYGFCAECIRKAVDILEKNENPENLKVCDACQKMFDDKEMKHFNDMYKTGRQKGFCHECTETMSIALLTFGEDSDVKVRLCKDCSQIAQEEKIL
jgi:hypothetical protein